MFRRFFVIAVLLVLVVGVTGTSSAGFPTFDELWREYKANHSLTPVPSSVPSSNPTDPPTYQPVEVHFIQRHLRIGVELDPSHLRVSPRWGNTTQVYISHQDPESGARISGVATFTYSDPWQTVGTVRFQLTKISGRTLHRLDKTIPFQYGLSTDFVFPTDWRLAEIGGLRIPPLF